MPKLEGIVVFVAVAETGGISAAARRLRLAKSVVSERLAELERSVGAPLVHRTTRRLSLTEDGLAFLDRAAAITRDVEAAVAELAERRGTLSGPLRISAPVTFGRLHLGPAIYGFLLRHARVELTLELDDRRVDPAADGHDAVVRHGVLEDSRLMAWTLASSQRRLVAAPAYLSAHGTPDSLAALGLHRGIFYTNRGVADWRFVTPTGPATVRGEVALRVNNGDIMRDAALAGLGIALLPSWIAGSAIREGRLVVIELGVATTPEVITLNHADGRRPSAKLRALLEHLRQAFGSPPYWDAV